MPAEELIVYLNGSYVAAGQAKVSVFDRCFLYGDGIFEGITVWKGVPFEFETHMQRMAKGLAYLCIRNPLSPDQWLEAVMEVIERNHLRDGYLRPQISRGEGISSVRWEEDKLQAPSNVVIIPVRGLIYGDALKTGFRAKILSRPRIPSKCIPAAIKHCNYLDSVLGAIEVSHSGYDIGIAIDENGFVTEGLAYNLFSVKDGKVFTPPLIRDLLPGVTRAALIRLFRKNGVPVVEEDFDVYTMCSADEVFFTSTLRLGGPIVEIDGRPINDGQPGPLTQKAGELLLAAMEKNALEFDSQTRP